MKITTFTLVSIFLILGCSSPNASKSKSLNNIENIEEDHGFLNIPFTIVNQSNQNGYLVSTVQALNSTDTLELNISLKEGILPGFVNGAPKNMFVQDGIKFESTGSRSNKLFNVLAAKYGQPNASLEIKDKQIFTCANLTQNPIDYKKGNPQFKIFLEEETDYAELYVNFDFRNSTISLSEKDPEYRTPLIKLMKK